MSVDAKKVSVNYGDQSMERYEAIITGGAMQAGEDHYIQQVKSFLRLM